LQNVIKLLSVLFFQLCLYADYQIDHIKHFHYTGGAHTNGPDAIGRVVVFDGYFWAPDHDPKTGYGGLWRVDECGNNPGFTDTDSDRDGPIVNAYIGKKYIYTNFFWSGYHHRPGFVYDHNGQKLQQYTFLSPYEVNDFVYSTDGNFYDISNLEDIKKAGEIPTQLGERVRSIQGNSVYANGHYGEGNYIYVLTSKNLYLFTQNSDGTLKLEDMIELSSSALDSYIFSDDQNNLYLYDNAKKKITLYHVQNDSFNLVKSGTIENKFNYIYQFFISHIGGKTEALFLARNQVVYWYDITDLNNISFRTSLNLSSKSYLRGIWVKDHLLFTAEHYGIDIYMLKGENPVQDILIKEKEHTTWQKEEDKKEIWTTSDDEAIFLVKIGNHDEKENINHEDITPILKAKLTNDHEDFDIKYLINNTDITSQITSSDGYDKSHIKFGEDLILEIRVKALKEGAYDQTIEISSEVIPKTKCGTPIGSNNTATVKAIIEKKQSYLLKAFISQNCHDVKWSDPITTQITNKKFNVQVLAQTEDTQQLATKIEVNKIDLVECNSNKVIKELWKGNLQTDANGCLNIPDLYYENSTKCATLKVTTNNKETSNIKTTSVTSDTFSIRPDHYVVFISTIKDNIFKAQKDFNLTIQALDIYGNIVTNYQENINTLDISVKEKNPKCHTPNLLLPKNRSFKNGILSISDTKVDDIGNIQITIKEQDPYAKIDTKDTPSQKDLLIGEAKTPFFRVYPDSLDITADFKGMDDNHTTIYYAKKEDIYKMGAEVSITAATDVTNFTSTCYSEDLNISINFQVDGSESKGLTLLAMSSNTKEEAKIEKFRITANRYKTTNSINYHISKSDFNHEGKSIKKVNINFERENNKALEPTKFTVKTISITANESKVNSLVDVNKTVYYYYLRADVASPQRSKDTKLQATVYPQVYCNSCDKNIFFHIKKQTNQINWYHKDVSSSFFAIKDSFSSTADAFLTIKKVSGTDDKIEIQTSSRPLKARVFYTPEYEWLLYDKYDPNITKHHFDVHFLSASKIWAGEGNLGTTIKTPQEHSIDDDTISW